MNSTEKELLIDYHQTCIYLLNNQWKDAAEIIGDYVLITSSNPRRHEIPVKKALVPLLTSIPGGVFPGFEEFKAFIEKIREYLDSDRLFDPTFKLN
ncbi:MAG: hypothetical protein PHG67_06070 [Bacteroidales bacterium]|jgi:hypothetical protein|nr:hypothetical protein [Bacteroidales bacterium]MDD4373463.1 hypothetical protein [Bacteroidales bacterium]HOI31206.1 hypothetical protein [Bacteroidales bacterium]